jgi:DNA polymerase V
MAERGPGPDGRARPTKAVRLPVPLANFARELAAAKKSGDVAAFFDIEGRSALRIPMMAWSAACGFPSPAEDYVDQPLDFIDPARVDLKHMTLEPDRRHEAH